MVGGAGRMRRPGGMPLARSPRAGQSGARFTAVRRPVLRDVWAALRRPGSTNPSWLAQCAPECRSMLSRAPWRSSEVECATCTAVPSDVPRGSESNTITARPLTRRARHPVASDKQGKWTRADPTVQ
jgi:hypothetical protein